jgi:hypothetical protein
MSTKQAIEQIPDPPLTETGPITSPSSPEYSENDQGDDNERLKDKAGIERTKQQARYQFCRQEIDYKLFGAMPENEECTMHITDLLERRER